MMSWQKKNVCNFTIYKIDQAPIETMLTMQAKTGDDEDLSLYPVEDFVLL